MSDIEKIKKFEELQKGLWVMAINGNSLQSILASGLIRQFEIEGPNGEDPECS